MPATRTPEGESNRCSVCGAGFVIEHSLPPGDACCPACGSLVWLAIPRLRGVLQTTVQSASASARKPSESSRAIRANARRQPERILRAGMMAGSFLGVLSGLTIVPVILTKQPLAVCLHAGVGVAGLSIFVAIGTFEGLRLMIHSGVRLLAFVSSSSA